MTNPKYEQESYWCNKCKRFHNPTFKKQPSITHKEHFCYFRKYKKHYSQSELFKLGFKEAWKRESKKQEKERSNPLYIN